MSMWSAFSKVWTRSAEPLRRHVALGVWPHVVERPHLQVSLSVELTASEARQRADRRRAGGEAQRAAGMGHVLAF